MQSYRRAGIGLQGLIEGEVHDLVRRYRADPRLWLRGYDQLAHLKPGIVLELEVSAADRLLAIWTRASVILADVGGHDVTGRYTRAKLRIDESVNEPAPSLFWPDTRGPRLFADRTDEPLSVFHNEMSPDWVHYLSDQQYRTVASILEDWDRYARTRTLVHFVVGGPGTGKTSVLLALLKDLTELGCDVRICMSDRLADYVRASLGVDAIEPHRGHVDVDAPDALLIDDPSSYRNLTWPLRRLSTTSRTRLLVIGFDPCQLLDSLSDSSYVDLVSRYAVSEHVLTECYRQKKVVGRAAQATFHAIAMSSAFFKPEKIDKFRLDHQRLTALSNETTFVNRGGYAKAYVPKATIADLRHEVARVAKYPQWTHWPSVLAIIDSEASLPRPWLRELEGLRAESIDETEIEQIKGLEYQHALLFLGPDLQKRLSEVINGQGKRGYFDTRLLRIPISRAKDSVVVFGLS